MGPAIRGLRLLGDQVVREPDHRQPVRPGQHRRPAERGLPREPLPGRRGADQLGLHHQGRQVAGAREPAGAVRRPEPHRPQPGPADRPGRHHPDLHARHAGRPPGRHHRPDDRRARVDDGERRQRLRARVVPAQRHAVPRRSLRVPSDVRLGRPAWDDLGRAHLERRLLG